jgi:putative oxidoreductase
MSRLGQTTTVRQSLRDLAALVARVGVGGIFFANGWTKLEDGLTATGAKFLQQGAPAPGVWATVTMLTELIGGALLIAGLVVSVMGLILFAEALAVFLVAPPLNPISVNELILLGAASLLLAVVGAGRVSVDHMVVIRRRESAAADEFAAETEADEVIAALRGSDVAKPDRPAGGSAQEGTKPPGRSAARSPGTSTRASGSTSAGKEPGEGGLEDTAPHLIRKPGTDPASSDEPAAGASPGDTLVAGRKKPPARGRKVADEE